MLCAHRKELDFESVLDESRTIAPCPEVLMRFICAYQGCQHFEFLFES